MAKRCNSSSDRSDNKQQNIESLPFQTSTPILSKKYRNIMKKSSYHSIFHAIQEYEQKLQTILHSYNDKKLAKQLQRRTNKFIFIPGIPFPYHSTTNTDMDRQIYLTHLRDSQMLLRMGKETIRLLSKQKKGNHCPIPIFIPMKNNYINFDPKHMLSTYSSKIINESQLCSEFHISSHGYTFPLGIDSINPFKRLSPKELAMKFNQMFVAYKMETILKSKKIIKFIFHTCNGAFCNIERNDTKHDVTRKILNESFIGIFYSAMNAFGYDNIVVIGYRGFYSTMSSGSGVRIGNRLVNPTVDIDCKQVEYTICTNSEVYIPTNYNFELLHKR